MTAGSAVLLLSACSVESNKLLASASSFSSSSSFAVSSSDLLEQVAIFSPSTSLVRGNGSTLGSCMRVGEEGSEMSSASSG